MHGGTTPGRCSPMRRTAPATHEARHTNTSTRKAAAPDRQGGAMQSSNGTEAAQSSEVRKAKAQKAFHPRPLLLACAACAHASSVATRRIPRGAEIARASSCTRTYTQHLHREGNRSSVLHPLHSCMLPPATAIHQFARCTCGCHTAAPGQRATLARGTGAFTHARALL